MNRRATDTAPSLTDLRAEVAKRTEDTRIARKHEVEAAARTNSIENVKAWISASEWLSHCAEAERLARVALILATSQENRLLDATRDFVANEEGRQTQLGERWYVLKDLVSAADAEPQRGEGIDLGAVEALEAYGSGS